MSDEVRVMMEGALYWVQASGQGTNGTTASAPTSGILAYVRSFTFTSANNTMQIMDWGKPSHNKVVAENPIDITFQCDYGATGVIPKPVSGGGATVPMVHLEYKMKMPEIGTAAGIWYQFYGVPVPSLQFTQGDPNTWQITTRALAMNGPTGTGVLIA